MTDSLIDIDDENHRPPVEVLAPPVLAAPFVYASPHSGRRYPAELLRISRLDRHALRQSEDGYVDLIFDAAPRFGAPLLRALFPRAYVDVNRSQHELDPRMFADALPRTADSRSNRVIAGLGVIPRIVADGQDIYSRKLNYFEARRRIAACYEPYHAALRDLIAARFAGRVEPLIRIWKERADQMIVPHMGESQQNEKADRQQGRHVENVQPRRWAFKGQGGFDNQHRGREPSNDGDEQKAKAPPFLNQIFFHLGVDLFKSIQRRR